MTQRVKMIHNSGTVLEFDVEEAEFYIVPPEDEDGNPNPNSGMLSGYKIDTGERMPIFWTRLNNIDVVMVERVEETYAKRVAEGRQRRRTGPKE